MKSIFAVAAVVITASLCPAAANASQKTREPKNVEKKEFAAVTKNEARHESAAAEQARLQKEARIPMEKAKQLALGHVRNGKIESAELEREGGKLIYSFDIREAARKDVTEVNIDAISGKLVAIDHETPRKEAVEKKQEAAEKKPASKGKH